jgi:predicted nucleic acid-binding protein
VILADTTVLNNFAQIRRSDLLRRAFSGVGSPKAVREELSLGERLGIVPLCDWSWLGTVELDEAEQSRMTELRRDLQAGEAACIAIAEARGGLVLTDDLEARRFAVALKINVSGTVGVLGKLLRRELLTLEQGDGFLAEMISRGYRSPVRSLREI